MKEKQWYSKWELAIIKHYEEVQASNIFKDRLQEINQQIAEDLEEKHLSDIEEIDMIINQIPCSQEKVAQRFKIIKQIEKLFQQYKYI